VARILPADAEQHLKRNVAGGAEDGLPQDRVMSADREFGAGFVEFKRKPKEGEICRLAPTPREMRWLERRPFHQQHRYPGVDKPVEIGITSTQIRRERGHYGRVFGGQRQPDPENSFHPAAVVRSNLEECAFRERLDDGLHGLTANTVGDVEAEVREISPHVHSWLEASQCLGRGRRFESDSGLLARTWPSAAVSPFF